MNGIYAIKLCGQWFLAEKSKMKEYHPDPDNPEETVWSEKDTTAFLGPVGEEEQQILLEEIPG
jgi:hypothetical protein